MRSSSVDLEVDLGPIPRRHDFEKGADGLRDAAAATDDLANVRFRNLQVELGEVAVQFFGDDHCRWIVDERASDVLEECPHAAGLRLTGHLTDAGTSPSGIPLRIRSERAVAVGLAPFLNQCRARSAFTTRLSGSARGS